MNAALPAKRSLREQLELRETPLVVWRALVATTFRDVPIPVALAALDFARALGVPPLGGHIWPIETRAGYWQLTPGLRFYRLMAARSGRWAGLAWSESDQLVSIAGTLSLPEWIECTALRFIDANVARFPARVYAREAVRFKREGGLLPTWADRPRHMLKVRAEALALPTGFPEWIGREDSLPCRAIDPESGEILEHSPRHLSSEDIAAGITHLPPDEPSAPDDDIPF